MQIALQQVEVEHTCTPAWMNVMFTLVCTCCVHDTQTQVAERMCAMAAAKKWAGHTYTCRDGETNAMHLKPRWMVSHEMTCKWGAFWLCIVFRGLANFWICCE